MSYFSDYISSIGCKSTSAMNKLAFLLLSCLICMLTTACNESHKDFEEDYATGVVLILNRSYYELALPNNESLYFTDTSEDGMANMTSDPNEVRALYAFGTGFLVSKKGEIATNNHVVAPTEDEESIKRNAATYIMQLRRVYAAYYKMLEYKKDSLGQVIMAKYAYNQDYSDDAEAQGQIAQKMNAVASNYNYLSELDADNAKLIYHCEVGVAFNDSYVEKYSDFKECVVKKTDRDHDLAIIQLKEKKVPDDVHIFEIPKDDPLTEYSIGDNISGIFGGDKNETLTMIGFNRGASLAITKEGIKAQITNGSISQDTKERLMYTIPALHGSSGSPVLNKRGELVAINYAGHDDTQSFNYGVKVKYLRYLNK